MPNRASIFSEITAERQRQDAKWGEQNHPMREEDDDAFLKSVAYSCRQICDYKSVLQSVTWLDILREEFYEAFAESDPARQREELVQVAAVAVEIIECIDRNAPPATVSCPKCLCVWPAETKTCPVCGHNLTQVAP